MDRAMKYLLVVMIVTLTACGGSEEYSQASDPPQDSVSLCEGMGGQASYLQVYNVNTGESYIDVECDFDATEAYQSEECEPNICKAGENCPIAECAKL